MEMLPPELKALIKVKLPKPKAVANLGKFNLTALAQGLNTTLPPALQNVRPAGRALGRGAWVWGLGREAPLRAAASAATSADRACGELCFCSTPSTKHPPHTPTHTPTYLQAPVPTPHTNTRARAAGEAAAAARQHARARHAAQGHRGQAQHHAPQREPHAVPQQHQGQRRQADHAAAAAAAQEHAAPRGHPQGAPVGARVPPKHAQAGVDAEL
ncbi:MAG: hypothetical protein J3K34DRAFT_41422 [Monoraphidium minutum]|nr:MAG: hypothetical protein J3K34DRAFT_41422 [Monoraphidium minutum]